MSDMGQRQPMGVREVGVERSGDGRSAHEAEMRDVIEYASPSTPKPPRWKGLKVFAAVTVILLLLLVIVFLLLPNRSYSAETARRVKCGSRLRQLKSALDEFARSNGGRYPKRLAELLESDADIVPDVFVCPSSGDRAAEGLGHEAAPQFNREKGHLSYIYIARGRQAVDDPTVILLYEPVSNHQGDGGHVVFGDSTVEWHDAASLQKLVGAGSPATRPSTRQSATGASRGGGE